MAKRSSLYEHPEAITGPEARWISNMRPVRRRKQLGTTTKKWIIRGALGLFILCVFIAIYAAADASRSSSEAQQRFEDSYNPSFKVRYDDIGRQVILNWYNQDEPVVDIGANVTWPGSELTSDQGVAQSSRDREVVNQSSRIIPDLRHVMFIEGSQASRSIDPQISNRYPHYANPYEETNTYYVVMNNQAVTVTITLVIPDLENPGISPILVSPPTVGSSDRLGNTRSEISSDPGEGNGLVSTQVTRDLDNMIGIWASSWASNDTTNLKAITNDTTDRSYFGLGGWEADPNSINTRWSYAKVNPDDPQDHSTMVMEVQFTIYQQNRDQSGRRPEGEAGSTRNSDTQFSNIQTMNLLIEGADSGRPSIVAWGPSGSWSQLQPYENGMTPDEQNIKGQNLDHSSRGSSSGSGSSGGSGVQESGMGASSSSSSSSSGSSSGNQNQQPRGSSGSSGDSGQSSNGGSNSESDSSDQSDGGN